MDGQQLEGRVGVCTQLLCSAARVVHVKTKAGGGWSKTFRQKWQWGPSSLILKKWRIDFDARKETHNQQQIWAILPGFPMVFFQKLIPEAIENKLGKFVAPEDD